MIFRVILMLIGPIVQGAEWVMNLIAEVLESLPRLLEQTGIQKVLAFVVAVSALGGAAWRVYRRQIDTAARYRGRYHRLTGALESRYRALRRRG
jgi:hypothetical protein